MAPLWLLNFALAAGPSCPDAAGNVAKSRYAMSDYSGAISALADLEVCPDGTDLELAEALRWRAQAKAAAGDTNGSIEAWALLATVKPTYALDALESPKFHTLFAQGRTKAEKGRLVFARLVRTLDNRALVQVFDPRAAVKRVVLKVDKRELAASKQSDGLYAAELPEGADSAVVVLESSEAVIFRSLKVMLTELPATPTAVVAVVATAAAPRPVPAGGSEGPSRTTWLIIGGSVVAAAAIAGIATGVVLSSRKIDGSLGNVQLPLEGSPTR